MFEEDYEELFRPSIERCDECGGHYPYQETKYLDAPFTTSVARKGERLLMCDRCIEELCCAEANKILNLVSQTDVIGYSRLHLTSIMAVTGINLQNAKELYDFLSYDGGHPDWSEASWWELYCHLNGAHRHYTNS